MPEQLALDRQLREAIGETAGEEPLVASVMDPVEGHSIGLNYARTEAGWLLSLNFRPNEELAETRYQWRPRRLPTLEAGVRPSRQNKGK